MSAMKVVPEVRWHVEAEKIDARTYQLDITLIERGSPVAGFGGDIDKGGLADLIKQLQRVLAEAEKPS